MLYRWSWREWDLVGIGFGRRRWILGLKWSSQGREEKNAQIYGRRRQMMKSRRIEGEGNGKLKQKIKSGSKSSLERSRNPSEIMLTNVAVTLSGVRDLIYLLRLKNASLPSWRVFALLCRCHLSTATLRGCWRILPHGDPSRKLIFFLPSPGCTLSCISLHHSSPSYFLAGRD